MADINLQKKLAPSILSADFAILGQQIELLEKAGADMIHIDVMDGDFVPSISFGLPVISSIRKITKLKLDVHLMVTEPGRFVEELAACGVEMITVHAEACIHLDRVIRQIKEHGMKAGIALNPATPLEMLTYVMELVDMVLIMTVNPGFGGQKYIEECTDKISALRTWLNRKSLFTDIQVDGGITPDNVSLVLDAGANVIVSGTSVFQGDIKQNIAEFKKKFAEQV